MFEYIRVIKNVWNVKYRGIVIGKVIKESGGFRPLITGKPMRFDTRQEAADVLKSNYKPVRVQELQETTAA